MPRRRFAVLLGLAAIVGALPAYAQEPQKYLIFFEEWSAQLDAAAQDVISQAAGHARQNPTQMINVAGFADTTGSKQANYYLSLLRAQVVSDKLVEKGVASSRLQPVGEGSVNYVGSAQESRRVEIHIGTP